MTINRRAALGLAATPLLIAAPTAIARVPPRSAGYRYMIMPDILRIGSQTKTAHENCWTTHYVWMGRGTEESGWILPAEIAHVNGRRYREWLEEGDYFEPESEPGIPPHISFGGAVVSGAGDPTFHARWVAYAQNQFGHWLQKAGS